MREFGWPKNCGLSRQKSGMILRSSAVGEALRDKIAPVAVEIAFEAQNLRRQALNCGAACIFFQV
jgi:hypothetical protein